jgi:hypothetical protein
MEKQLQLSREKGTYHMTSAHVTVLLRLSMVYPTE